MTAAHPALLLLVLLVGCKQPPEERHFMTAASIERGERVIERAGCASCHDIPGIAWPRGRLGPPLDGFADRRLIAGRLPNQPEPLAAFIRDAPSLVPGTAMPTMPVTREEARDAAAYLYALNGS